MRVFRMLPWDPAWGPGLDAEPPEAEIAFGEADYAAERDCWAPVPPASAAAAGTISIVDGARRTHGYAIGNGGDPALFGSYAIGAVRCGDGPAGIPADGIGVERLLLVAANEAGPPFEAGGMTFRAETCRAATPGEMRGVLQRRMLRAEQDLAERLARGGGLAVLDGPLRRPHPEGEVAGFVKQAARWLLDAGRHGLLARLAPGERTPLIRFREPAHPAVYTWYLRLAALPAPFHQIAGVVRMEVSAELPLARAAAIADRCALALPPLASAPGTDPRAPQSLVPVAALERELARRLGDGDWIRKRIGAAAAARQ